MSDTDPFARARYLESISRPTKLEAVTRAQQDWPGPVGGGFLAKLAEADEAVIDLEIDAQHAIESRELAERALAEGRYEWKDVGALDPDERHVVAELHMRISRALPKIDAYMKAKAERDRMAAWFDKFRLGSGDSISLNELEAQLGPDDGSLRWMERADALVTKRRRDRGDGPARGAILPPPDGLPPSGHWRG
jgi:hypothetical protein